MILVSVLLVLLAGALGCVLAEKRSSNLPAVVALFALGSAGILLILLLLAPELLGVIETSHAGAIEGLQGEWLMVLELPWIPRFGATFLLALDGLGMALVLLSLFIGLIAVLAAQLEIRRHPGIFHGCLLLSVAGAIGVFTALDLLLFFFFWEAMLIPLFLMLVLWKRENNGAAIRFLIFTQLSSLLMLCSVILLAFSHLQEAGSLSFNYFELVSQDQALRHEHWVMAGFFIAFATKSALLPFHAWLPDTHDQAPTAVSILLTGIFLSSGAYGLIRFTVTLFPELSLTSAPLVMSLAAINIIYGGVLAFSQYRLKRILAYASISHMGFLILGIFAWNHPALEGAVIGMLSFGISSSALFFLAGILQQRQGSQHIDDFGGLASRMPQLALAALSFIVAGLGMPLAGNFVAKLLILLGSFQQNVTLSIVAAIGTLLSAAYLLRLLHRIFYGPAPTGSAQRPDMGQVEWLGALLMLAALLWLGLSPQFTLDLIEPGIRSLEISNEHGAGS